MGNSSSSPRSRPTARVFERELSDLKRAVSSVVDLSVDGFRHERHATLSRDVCEHYAVVISDRLAQYPKVDLRSVGSSLYLVPKKRATKDDLCRGIAEHYARILRVLTLVSRAYDLANDGDLSIAGIVLRNVRVAEDVMEIHYCDAPQGETQKADATVDFSRLAGFEPFVRTLLDKRDAAAFMAVFRDVLGRKPASRVAATVKRHAFRARDLRDLEAVLGIRLVAGNPNTTARAGTPSMLVQVADRGPLLSRDLCYASRRLLVKASSRDVRRAYDAFFANYHRNVGQITACVHRLVDVEAADLRSVTAIELDDIVLEVCRVLKAFYIQSVVDYQRLLDAAQNGPGLGSFV